MLIKRAAPIVIAGALAALVPAAAADKGTLATAVLANGTGAPSGQVQLRRSADGLELKISVRGLPPGIHGVHLHAVGTCTKPDFTSAGPHLNPQAKMHGLLNPQGAHMGDLPNIEVGADGRGSTTAMLMGDPQELVGTVFDKDGTAVVVHATADDYRTDPSGNSGGRIACGVLRRSR